MVSVRGTIEDACALGRPVRLHTDEGEVLVARVMRCDADEIVYAPLTSSHPERYGVCDAPGFSLPLNRIRRAELVGASRDRHRTG